MCKRHETRPVNKQKLWHDLLVFLDAWDLEKESADQTTSTLEWRNGVLFGIKGSMDIVKKHLKRTRKG